MQAPVPRCFISGEECNRGKGTNQGGGRNATPRDGVKWRDTGDNLRSTIRPYNGDNVLHPMHAPFSTVNTFHGCFTSLPDHQLENYLSRLQ